MALSGPGAITAGVNYYALILLNDGSLLAMGNGTDGRLGTNSTVHQKYPVPALDAATGWALLPDLVQFSPMVGLKVLPAGTTAPAAVTLEAVALSEAPIAEVRFYGATARFRVRRLPARSSSRVF